MDSEKEDAVTVWKPKEFKGNDILPYEDIGIVTVEGVPDLVGRENIDPDDLILPSLALLHGTSTAVEQNSVEGAEPGLFMHTGTEEVLPEGSVRLIFVHHHKGNALFPKDDPRYAELETCISRDQVEGTVYGLCQECRKCLDWDNENNLPPLGAQTHHFVAMSSLGPVMMRFARSSYKAANQFVSSWSMSRKNLWAHPVVVRVATGDKTLPSGKVSKYFKMQMAWQTTEKVPDELQRTAFALYKEIESKHESGNLKSQDEGQDDPPDETFTVPT